MEYILLVEDSVEIQKLVIGTLGKRVEVIPALTVAEGLSLVEKYQFSLIIIDIMLPDGDGFQLCSALQSNEKTRGIPAVFLTGKEGITDKVMAFSLGADDYIVKPFQPLEFRARIEAKLKKYRERKEDQEIIQKEDLWISVPYQKAFLIEGTEKRDLGLTPIEFRLLLNLARRERQVFSRDQLLTAVWGDDVYITDRSIDTHISSLRKKLDKRAYYVQSVYGSGYLFSTVPKKQRPADEHKVESGSRTGSSHVPSTSAGF